MYKKGNINYNIIIHFKKRYLGEWENPIQVQSHYNSDHDRGKNAIYTNIIKK